jgi:hypothetical protein
MQDPIIDGEPQVDLTMPSNTRLLGLSGYLPTIGSDGRLTWGVKVDGRTSVLYQDLPATLSGDAWTWPYGIPSHGTYCLTDASVGGVAPEVWSHVDAARQLGTWCWGVGEGAGLLNGTATEAFLSAPPEPLPYDPEVARQLLDEAGWLPE